jgi:hypothetical protein
MQMASRYLVAVNILANKQRFSSLAVGQAANTPYHKNITFYGMEQTEVWTTSWLFKNYDDTGLDKGS